jgi:hypothetical protein
MVMKLSQTQQELILYLSFRCGSSKGRVLHRFDGGFWASATEKTKIENLPNPMKVPVRHWGTGTVDSLAAGAQHKSEVSVKRLAALEKAWAVRKTRRERLLNNKITKCGRCGHILAICICPPLEERVAVGTLGGEVL